MLILLPYMMFNTGYSRKPMNTARMVVKFYTHSTTYKDCNITEIRIIRNMQ